jgi:hypothetical protein
MKMPMSEFVLIVVGVAMFLVLFLAEPCGGAAEVQRLNNSTPIASLNSPRVFASRYLPVLR